jgi:hypothetical protein
MNLFKKKPQLNVDVDENIFRGNKEHELSLFSSPSPLLTTKSPRTEEQIKRHSSIYTPSPVQQVFTENIDFVDNFIKKNPSIMSPKQMSMAEQYNIYLSNKQMTESPMSQMSEDSPSIFETTLKNAFAAPSWEEYVNKNSDTTKIVQIESPKYDLDDYYIDSDYDSENSDMPNFLNQS